MLIADNIYKKIVLEIKRAKKLHPFWPKDLLHQIAIVGEEMGEATRAVNQYVYEGGSIQNIEDELYQTATTCIRMLECIESKDFFKNTPSFDGKFQGKMYFFPCKDPSGLRTRKSIAATCEEHAILKFDKKFPKHIKIGDPF